MRKLQLIPGFSSKKPLVGTLAISGLVLAACIHTGEDHAPTIAPHYSHKEKSYHERSHKEKSHRERLHQEQSHQQKPHQNKPHLQQFHQQQPHRQQSFLQEAVQTTRPASGAVPSQELPPVRFHDTLTLISLNLAHGRKDGFSQVFMSGEKIRRNLADIADYIKSRNADVVALQEADGPSLWSGNFDHVEYLATLGEVPHYTRSEHVNAFFGNYGTGVLSHLAIDESRGYNFKPTPPTTNKGFTLTTVVWPHNPQREPVLVDVLSLHLDFLNPRARRQQIRAVQQVIAGRDNPLIVMGDFNSEAIATEFLPKTFAAVVQLQAYTLPEDSLGTYGDDFLDWVLISPELEFVRYQVDDVVLSDHRPVLLELRLQPAKLTLEGVESPINSNSFLN